MDDIYDYINEELKKHQEASMPSQSSQLGLPIKQDSPPTPKSPSGEVTKQNLANPRKFSSVAAFNRAHKPKKLPGG